MKKLLLCFLLISPALSAQSTDVKTPLHKFLQANFDSTIIYHGSSSWYVGVDYKIIAKEKNKVYFFTYKSPYRWTRGVYFPGKLKDKFWKAQSKFQKMPPDTNQYFLPFPLKNDQIWYKITSQGLWDLKDDNQIPNYNEQCIIDDGGDNTFFLITRSSSKVLNFSESGLRCEVGEKNINRLNASKILDLIFEAFKEN